MDLYDLPHVLPLTPEEATPETDLIPIWHNRERSISLAALGQAIGGGGTAPPAGVSQATFDEFKANVIADLNNLRDTIMLMQTSLDADAGVSTDTWVADGTPPPLLTV